MARTGGEEGAHDRRSKPQRTALRCAMSILREMVEWGYGLQDYQVAGADPAQARDMMCARAPVSQWRITASSGLRRWRPVRCRRDDDGEVRGWVEIGSGGWRGVEVGLGAHAAVDDDGLTEQARARIEDRITKGSAVSMGKHNHRPEVLAYRFFQACHSSAVISQISAGSRPDT
jgi:hypothetical protein